MGWNTSGLEHKWVGTHVGWNTGWLEHNWDGTQLGWNTDWNTNWLEHRLVGTCVGLNTCWQGSQESNKKTISADCRATQRINYEAVAIFSKLPQDIEITINCS